MVSKSAAVVRRRKPKAVRGAGAPRLVTYCVLVFSSYEMFDAQKSHPAALRGFMASTKRSAHAPRPVMLGKDSERTH